MNTKLYLLLLTLISCTTMYSMDSCIITTPSLPQEIWFRIIAQCSAKYKLRETCTYFRDAASTNNIDIFLQNPLICDKDLLEKYALYYADLDETAVIRNLLNQGLNPNLESKHKYRIPQIGQQSSTYITKSLLYYAVENENTIIINKLLNHPLLNKRMQLSLPFKRALELNLLEIAQNMITINTINLLAYTYCYHAADHNIAIIKHILSLNNGSGVPFPLSTLLSHAADNGHIKLATFVLNHSAEFNYELLDDTQFNISMTHPAMLNLLLKYGAKFDTIVNNKKLQSAISTGNINTVLFLINQGASLATHPSKQSLLSHVIRCQQEECCIQLIQILLNKGVDINEKSDSNNNTALGVAAEMSRIEAIKILLACPDINVNVPNSQGLTPLDIVIEKRNKWNQMHCKHCDSVLEINFNFCGFCGEKNYTYRENIIIRLLSEHGAKTGAELAQTTEDKK